MSHKQLRCRKSLFKAVFEFAAILVLMLAGGRDVAAQSATGLSQVKTIYVEPFGQESATARLREKAIEQFQRQGLEVVAAREKADAVVKGSGSIWLTGYVSTDPRSPSTTRKPIFHGFLSFELIGRDSDPLWSYLVTPSKFRAGEITNDLADRLAEKLLQARKQHEGAPEVRTTEPTGETALNAAGATFPAPLYQKWFESFQQRHPNAAVEYRSVGSEAGIQLLLSAKVDFAASDVPLSNQQMAQSKRTFLHFASVIGAVVPVYNLKEMGRNLNFTPEALAGIYLGKIKRWNDPAIRDANRDVALPATEIVVIHRSDGSGTTFIWTDYLSKVSPEWKASIGPGTVVGWPVGTSAEGNEGVASMVEQTPNAIGYVELEYALTHQLNFGAVQNRAGKFIQADLSSVTAAGADASAKVGSDFRVSLTDSSNRNAYPIAAFTWWLVPQDLPSDKRRAMNELLQWMLSSGQKESSALAYAPLPREVVNREVQLLDQLK